VNIAELLAAVRRALAESRRLKRLSALVRAETRRAGGR
jgi:hypothetical protein